MEDITFVSSGYLYKLRLAKKYVTKKRLEALFALDDDAVVVTLEGDEVPEVDGTYPDLSPHQRYMVASEKDIDELDDEGDQNEAPPPKFFTPERVQRMTIARREMIKELYTPLHPHLFNLTDNLFVPSFLKALNDFKATKDPSHLTSILKKETPTRLYTFEIFTLDFCNQLIEEVENFEKSGLPVSRPNSMNNYGLILDEIGFKPFFDRLTSDYIMPFTAHLYPDYSGADLDSHHAFIVQYKITEDLDLDFHYDSSEVTLNLNLGKQFEGGALYFAGLLNDPSTHDENFEFHHVPGRALLHVGKHRHGAHSIKSGERYNMIVWFANTALRKREVAEHSSHGHHH